MIVPSGQMRRRAFLRTALASGAATPLLACGRGHTSGTQAAAPGGAASAQPRDGGTLNVPTVADFYDFDNSTNGKANSPTQIGYDTLLSFRQGPGVPYADLVTRPKLASSWEITTDASSYTFHLRPGVAFAPLPPVNGRALTSEDVRFSYEYYSRGGALKDAKLKPSLFGYMFEGLDRIETPDAQTLFVRFKQPFVPFLSYASAPVLPIVPREIYDSDGNFSNQMIGSGPLQLDKTASQHGTQWVLRKNAAYWDKGKPHVGEIRYLVVPDDATQQAAFRAKQLDILQGLTDPAVLPALQASNPDAVVQESIDPSTSILWLSVSHPPFSDLRLRQAVSLALDRDELSHVMTAGKAGWAMPASLPDMWTQAQIKQILKHDPQQARQLLAAAGYADGLAVEIMTNGASQAKIAQLVQGQLKQADINLAIKPVDTATYGQKLHSGDFIASVAQAFLYADLDSRLFGAFHSGSGSNYAGVSDPTLDHMIEAQRREPDRDRRETLLKSASRYLAENAYETTLYQQIVISVWHPYVRNYADNWMQLNWNAPDVWLSR